MKKVTIRDIAKASGVSIYTVSSVLHDKKDVSAATRERVQKIIKELKYDPLNNIPLARNLRTAVRSIGLVVPHPGSSENTFFYRAIQAARTATSARGYDCKLFSEEDISARLQDGNARQLGCTGVIACCTNLDWQRYMSAVLRDGIAAALIRRKLDDAEAINITNDDARGGRLIMEHLADAGHTVIAQAGGRLQQGQAVARFTAWQEVRRERNLCDDPRLRIGLHECGHDPGTRIRELRAAGMPVTAVCCCDDGTAAGTIRSLGRAGLRVPDDIAVTGYNDDPVARQLYPSLTTVRLPIEEMVTAACERLTDGNDDKGDIVFEDELIVRESA